MKTDGALGNQLRTPPWDSLNGGVMFSQEMRCIWTLLRARRKGLEVRRDGVKDVTGDVTPSLHGGLEDLKLDDLISVQQRCSANISIPFRLFVLFSAQAYFSTHPLSSSFQGFLYFLVQTKLKMYFHLSAHSPRPTRQNDNMTMALQARPLRMQGVPCAILTIEN